MEMQVVRRGRMRGRVLWGLVLIGIGVIFLLDRLGVVGAPDIGRWWPGIFVVMGFARVLDRRPGAGLMLLAFGATFFAANEHWYGLSYQTAWPILIVAVGLGIVVRALTGEDAAERERRRARRDEI